MKSLSPILVIPIIALAWCGVQAILEVPITPIACLVGGVAGWAIATYKNIS